jgi:hypothetical protein
MYGIRSAEGKGKSMRLTVVLLGMTLTGVVTPSFAQTPHVVSTSPSQNELNVAVSSDISVTSIFKSMKPR